MKKLILMTAFALGILSNANAQDDTVHLKFGAKAGVNFANYIGDATDGLEARTSFHVGGVVEIFISEKFSFQPELVYSSQGTKAQVEDSGFTIEVVDKADYLNVPLMAKFYATEGFSIEVGPQIGFLLSAKQEASTNSQGTDVSATVDVKDMRNSIDFGVNFGLGYKLTNGLNFGARYNLGISDINDVQGNNDKNQNSVIQLSVGFMF